MIRLRGLRPSASRRVQGVAGSSWLCARLGAVRPLRACGRPSSALPGEGGVFHKRSSPVSTTVRAVSPVLEERDERAGEERVARFRHIYDKLARGKLISKKDLKHGIEQTLSYSVRIADPHLCNARPGPCATQAAAPGVLQLHSARRRPPRPTESHRLSRVRSSAALAAPHLPLGLPPRSAAGDRRAD
jgi:hypothetical protein